MTIYQPREDSYLIKKHIKKHSKGIVLDMGTGSGVLAVEAAESKKVKKVVAVDIQKRVINHLKKTIKNKKIEFVTSNLFINLKKLKFDTILFNPPYLPEEPKLKDLTLDGGKKGHEIIEKFFKSLKPHLNKDAKILLIFSSLTNQKKVDQIIKKAGFRAKLLEKQHIFFEDLFVYLVKK